MGKRRIALRVLKGSYKERLEDILKRAGVDLGGLRNIKSRELARDVHKFSLKAVPVYTGTLKRSGRMRLNSGKDWYGGTVTFDATQQQQYDNISQNRRYGLMVAKKTRNLHNYHYNDNGEIVWDLEDPNASYVDKLPHTKEGVPVFIDKAVNAAVNTKKKITADILGKKVSIDNVDVELKKAYKNAKISIGREQLRQETERIRAKRRKDTIKDLLKEIDDRNKDLIDLNTTYSQFEDKERPGFVKEKQYERILKFVQSNKKYKDKFTFSGSYGKRKVTGGESALTFIDIVSTKKKIRRAKSKLDYAKRQTTPRIRKRKADKRKYDAARYQMGLTTKQRRKKSR